MSLSSKPLAGRAAVAWRDRSRSACGSIQDVIDERLPAVISMTEHADLDHRDELSELYELAQSCPLVEYIIATKQWIQLGDKPLCDLTLMRRLGALSNVSLALIFSNETGLVNVKGVSLCWDYSSGTPRSIPSTRVGGGGKRAVFRGYHYIGQHDWVLRTKAVRSVLTANWHDFNRF